MLRPPVPEVREPMKTELDTEKQRRQSEHDRTDRLARVLADYRRQDGILRR